MAEPVKASLNTSGSYPLGLGHPVLKDETDYQKLIPFMLHADGAQFYRDDEMFRVEY